MEGTTFWQRLKYNWTKPSTNDDLSLKEMVAFSGAAMGQNFWWGLKGYMMVFYTIIMGLDIKQIGIMFLVVGIWDAINDPIMGAIIDKTDTKWGKLRPYMLWTAAPIGILTFCLLFNPPFLGSTGKLVYVYITYVLWEMAYTISDVPLHALPVSMTSNTVQRTKLITIFAYGANIGLVLPGILPFFLSMVDPSKHEMIYTTAAAILSTLGAVLFAISFFFIKERAPVPEDKYSIFHIFKILAKAKPMMLMYTRTFLELVLHVASGTAYFFFFFAFLNGTGLPIISKVFTGHEGLGLMSLLGIAMGVPTFIAMAFTPRLAKRYEMKQIVLFACILRASSLILAFLIGFDRPWKIVLMILTFMIANIPQDMGNVASKNMQMDCYDYVEWVTGQRAEGLLSSVGGFVVKIKFSLAAFLTALLLAAVGVNTSLLEGLEGDAYNNALLQLADQINMKSLFALYTIIPAVGMILTMIPIYFYNLTGDTKLRMREELKEMRKQRAIERGISLEGIDLDDTDEVLKALGDKDM